MKTGTSSIVLIVAVLVFLNPGSWSWADTASKAAMAAFEKRFDEMDANEDGRIDRTEYVEYERKKANERFDTADEDRDGFITHKEAERTMKRKQAEMRMKMQEWREKQGAGTPK
jgi:Ca2+-binding EF-hand superfamily protein